MSDMPDSWKNNKYLQERQDRIDKLRAHDHPAESLGRDERIEATLRTMQSDLKRVIAALESKVEARLLTLDQAADYISRSRRAVEKLVLTRAFPVIRAGDRVHIDRRDLDVWIARNRG